MGPLSLESPGYPALAAERCLSSDRVDLKPGPGSDLGRRNSVTLFKISGKGRNSGVSEELDERERPSQPSLQPAVNLS